MLLSRKSTFDAKPSARCPMAAAESYKNDFNIADIARKMGVNPTVLRSKLAEDCDTHILGFQQVIAIGYLTGDHRALEAWAYSLGKTTIDLPEVGLSDDEVADQILTLQETIGDFAKTFRLARQKGVITQSDFDAIQKNTLSIISTALQLNAEIEQMVRPDPNEPVAAKATSLKVA